MFHSSLELTWKWPVLSCLSILCFMLVMFGNNRLVKHIWQSKFCLDIVPGLQLFWRVVRSNASLWDIFFCFDGRLVSLPLFLCKLSVALHSIIHTIVKHVPLLFGSWRGSDLFSLVSASGVSSLWCLILTHGSNIYERWFFCWESVSGLLLFGVLYGPVLSCEIFFLLRWKTCVIAVYLV